MSDTANDSTAPGEMITKAAPSRARRFFKDARVLWGTIVFLVGVVGAGVAATAFAFNARDRLRNEAKTVVQEAEKSAAKATEDVSARVGVVADDVAKLRERVAVGEERDRAIIERLDDLAATVKESNGKIDKVDDKLDRLLLRP